VILNIVDTAGVSLISFTHTYNYITVSNIC
jgi:hypothetical protein